MPLLTAKSLPIKPAPEPKAAPAAKKGAAPRGTKAKAKPEGKAKGKSTSRGLAGVVQKMPITTGVGLENENCPLSIQGMSNFCWAACAQMVAASSAIGIPIDDIPSQEDLAVKVHHRLVDLPASPEQMESLYGSGALGGVIRCKVLKGSASKDALDDQLNKVKPVQIGVQFPNPRGGPRLGHVVIIAGVESTDGNREAARYIVHNPDPAQGTGSASFDGLLRGLGIPGGSWVLTIGNFSR